MYKKIETFVNEELKNEIIELDSITFSKENNENYLRIFLRHKEDESITINDCTKL